MLKTWKHARGAGAAALVAAMTMVGATAEAAEVKREPFQKAVHIPCGTGITACSARVLTIRANRRFEVRSVSCSFTVRSPGTVATVALVVESATAPMVDYLVPVQLGDDGSFRDFALNTQTLLIARAGDKLLIGANAKEDIFNINCKVAGEMVFLD